MNEKKKWEALMGIMDAPGWGGHLNQKPNDEEGMIHDCLESS